MAFKAEGLAEETPAIFHSKITQVNENSFLLCSFSRNRLILFVFVRSERYKRPSWETPIPNSHKLTEEDIDRFVESIKGVAMQAVFSKLGCSDVSVALQHLAILRPKMICPVLIER